MQTGDIATNAKRGRSTGAEFGSASAHQSCTTTAALASGHASRHKRCPSYLADLTRHAHRDVTSDLRLPDPPPYDAHELSSGNVHFLVFGPIVWNRLPTALRNIDSYPVSRRALKSHYLAVLFPQSRCRLQLYD